MADQYSSELAKRGRAAFFLGLIVLLVTTFSYYFLGCVTGMNGGFGKKMFSLEDDHWEVSECLYAAAITLTTVGYTDLLGTERLVVYQDASGNYRWDSGMDAHEDEGYDPETENLYHDFSWLTRLVTTVSVIVGIAFFLYVIAQITSFFVEGDYQQLRTVRWTNKRIARLSDHVVICGLGENARQAISRLSEDGVPCVAIDFESKEAEELRADFPGLLCLTGDCSEERILVDAGIERARALIANLYDDGLNLVVVVTARQLNPDLQVVSRGQVGDSTRRLEAAGAAVVDSGRLAGLRLASTLVRPTAVAYIDLILQPRSVVDLHLGEVSVPLSWGGEPLAAVRLREESGLEALALGRSGSDVLVYNLEGSEVLSAGDVLYVAGKASQIRAAKALFEATPPVEKKPELPSSRSRPVSSASDPSPGDNEKGHRYVICGLGDVGGWIARELVATGRSFSVVESDPEALDRCRAEFPGVLVIPEGAENPETLRKAGIEGCRGLATTLGSDRLNLVAAVTGLQAEKDLRVVSLASHGGVGRLARAGVEVCPRGKYGGGRMALEIIQPSVSGFLERMVADPRGVRIESVVVTSEGRVVGKALDDARIFEKTGLRPVALCSAESGVISPNPSGQEVLTEGTRIVLIGTSEQVASVVELVGNFE